MEFLLSKLDTRVNSAREVKNYLDRLINTLPRMNILMDKAEWLRFNDENVAHFLNQLRDAAYDAEDVIAEFKYYELQQQIEGKENRLLPSLFTFIKDLISNSASKVKDIQGRLDFVTAELEKATDLFGSSNRPTPHGKAVQHETSSFVTESMLGREKELEGVLQLMQESGDVVGSSSAKRRKTAGNFLILPIVGIGGVGKTTLAQQIYNNERVKKHFDLRIWVCVSDRFDLKKITKEMIESANRVFRQKESEFGIDDNLTNLDSLQHILKGKVQSRRYLVVLDDVWHENSRDLESLCNPLRSGLQGSMILVTTRLSKVAEIVGTHDPIKLGGLPENIYWDLFKKCSFGSLDSSLFPELEDIGMRIAIRLEGSPLAAKTLGGILRANMATRQWTNILNSDLWKIEQADGDILPALRVSYQHLPLHLKRCFSIFSLFPKDYPLYLNFLSPVWLADGLFSREESIFLEGEKGHRYFEEFETRSFIVRGEYNNTYLHDLMHDLAKSVSLDTCYCQEEDEWTLQNHDTVRHLSVYRKQIELINNEIRKCKKLRSLLFLDGLNYDTKLDPSSLRNLFNELPYLRVLDLWCCKIEELPENIGNLKLLFHLNLKGTNITSLPESICRLYNLRFLYLDGCPIENFPKSFTNLINLRIITEEMEIQISSMIPRIGKLISLEKLPEFKVLPEDGHGINELKNMTRLQDCIKISNLENVKDKKDAAQACLNKKKHLTSLTLSWSMGRITNPGKKETFIDEDILEHLEPHPNLEQLNVDNYGGIIPASWLKTEKLPSLHVLGIKGCSNLKSLDNWLVLCQLLSLRSLEINSCVNLDSLPLEWIVSSSIIWLIIKNCPMLKCPSNLNLPSSMSHLELDSCGLFDKSLPDCLMKVHFLKSLKLYNCQHVTSLPSQITHHLRSLELSNCAELQFLELSNPSIVEMLSIVKCTKLVRADPSTTDSRTPLERIKHLHTLVIDNTSLLKLPFLRNPPHSLGTLIIRDSTEESIFTRDVQGWLNGPENLVQLILWDCPNLESSPEELHAVINVKWLQIRNCPKFQSIPYCHL